MVPAVVLAAGASSRMGRPKALLPIDASGATFLARILATLTTAGVDDVLVVLGAQAGEIAAALGHLGSRVRLIGNPDPARGQLSSILIALDCIDRPGVEGLLVSLVDMPLVSAGTVRLVLDRHRRTRAPIVRPVKGSRHGHPVVFDRQVFDELRHAEPSAGARTVVRAHAGETEEVRVEDDGAFIDIDTPDDYRTFVGPYLDEPATD